MSLSLYKTHMECARVLVLFKRKQKSHSTIIDRVKLSDVVGNWSLCLEIARNESKWIEMDRIGSN